MDVLRLVPAYYDSNVYVVNGTVLIDAGMTPDFVMSGLEKLADVSKIELVILTHAHFDHFGAVEAILQKSGAKLGIYETDAPALKSDLLSCSLNFGFRTFPLEPDVLYQEGDKIRIGKGEDGCDEFLEVIFTPGHTSGCMCLYEKNSKSLFSGDTVFSEGGIGRSDFKNSAPEKMSESIQKLAKLDVQCLYPGHGNPTLKNANRSIEKSLKMSLMMNP
ncbi:MBL fold metallo-hydrolase [Methanolapillus ohkumae]|uniref:Hydroxyacylglutathione hydrolase n=1 Tax=Methanolapillus ohkumae TaxID=3028298 RepID=A0AA96ZUY3_9EURY|nr:Hydroxyacylglutathione hydrolase [Methanosarcinaceae archaeon Am2]